MRLLLCLLLLLPCRAQTPDSAVEGQVFNLASGEPLRKVRVLLRPSGSSERRLYGALSDASGRFAIAGIQPGRYVLTAERAGFVVAHYGRRRQSRRGSVLALAAGERLQDVVFRLTPHGVVTGRVLDEEGDTVAGAKVEALRTSSLQGRRALVPVSGSTSNDIGEYRIPGLAPGRYYLSVTYQLPAAFNRGGLEDRYAPTYYPGTADAAASAPLDIAEGQQLRGIDVTLTRVRTVRVAGRLSTPAGAVSRNTMVFLMPREGGAGGFRARNSTMAQEGRFEIRGVVPGSYVIAAHRYENGSRYTASRPIEVSEAGAEDIELVMTPGFEVKGRVRVEGEGQPELGGATVTLQPEGELMLAGPVGSRVGEGGSFRLTNVAPDRYRVLMAGLPERYYMKAARLGDVDMLENGADVNSGAGPLEILLSATGGEVQGVSLDARGQPAPGATVVLAPEIEHRPRRDLFRTAVADQYGRFTLQGIAPGDYKLFAWEEVENDAWLDPEFLRPVESAARSITVRENGRETVQVRLLEER